MSNFRKIAATILICELLLIVLFNALIFREKTNLEGRQYRVDIKRIEYALNNGEDVNVDDYDSIIDVVPFTSEYKTNNDYAVVNVNGELYSIEYRITDKTNTTLFMNLAMGFMTLVSLVLFIYLDKKVLSPFNRMTNYSVELAKGNLSNPIKEDKNKFFGKFLWGMDMLRDNLENNRRKELELQKEKKTLILSISHDIKTPLSAIKLYTRALKDNLYDTEEKRSEALDGIARNTSDIEKYVSDIVAASREDFLNLEATISEFYISEVISKISVMYVEKFATLHTDFKVGKFEECLLKGDKDRLEEVLQNMLENAIKYGDGKYVRIDFDEEEDCQLISITNSGCSIKEDEIPHLFDSFYRGTNSEKVEGSGLGLYIAKSLMKMMDGDVFAQINGDEFQIVAVVRKC